MFDRQTIVEWRARSIRNPIERLRFLQEQMGPDWPGRPEEPWAIRQKKWLLPAIAAACTVVLVSGYEFAHMESIPLSRPVILAPPATLSPEAAPETAVWVVDRKGEFETYSNGLRVENRYATGTQPRGRYRVYSKENVMAKQAMYASQPAGIVYHTTESDEAPFQAGQDRNLKRIGLGVLLYVQQNRSYHFVIDRFGRVFRIVREEDVAFHSGHSVWADERRVFVGLNTSFLAVAVETQTRPGEDTMTANGAQIYAARVLTQMLRSKYHIAAANCVTHAQVSVNPANGLIGYHTDWGGNFPFHEVGLGDNYMEPPASIVIFGFGYDPAYLQSTGTRLLPGLLRADNEVRTKAARMGLPVARYKALLQGRYMEIAAVKEDKEKNNGN